MAQSLTNALGFLVVASTSNFSSPA